LRVGSNIVNYPVEIKIHSVILKPFRLLVADFESKYLGRSRREESLSHPHLLPHLISLVIS